MIYTVTFNPAIDYVVQLEHLTQGTVNRTGDEAVYCGGKGINVSTVLTNLGIENVALGFLAGFTGDAVENALQRKGLRTDFIRLQNGMTRINVKIRGACETEINGKGPDIGPAALALPGVTERSCYLGAGAAVQKAGRRHGRRRPCSGGQYSRGYAGRYL